MSSLPSSEAIEGGAHAEGGSGFAGRSTSARRDSLTGVRGMAGEQVAGALNGDRRIGGDTTARRGRSIWRWPPSP